MTADEWLAAHATHTCPQYGGRFAPDRCEHRKAKAAEGRPAVSRWSVNAGEFAVDLSDCAACDGPVRIKEETVGDRAEVAKMKIAAAKETKYSCEIHGPHNGHLVGGRQTDNCPVCHEEKRVAGFKRAMESRIAIDWQQYPWLQEWLSEQAKAIDSTIQAVVLERLMALVPAEFIKEHYIKSVMG